jgi:hypothetical protein
MDLGLDGKVAIITGARKVIYPRADLAHLKK